VLTKLDDHGQGSAIDRMSTNAHFFAFRSPYRCPTPPIPLHTLFHGRPDRKFVDVYARQDPDVCERMEGGRGVFQTEDVGQGGGPKNHFC